MKKPTPIKVQNSIDRDINNDSNEQEMVNLPDIYNQRTPQQRSPQQLSPVATQNENQLATIVSNRKVLWIIIPGIAIMVSMVVIGVVLGICLGTDLCGSNNNSKENNYETLISSDVYAYGTVYSAESLSNPNPLVGASVIGYNGTIASTGSDGSYYIQASISEDTVYVVVSIDGYASTQSIAPYNMTRSIYYINSYLTKLSVVSSFNPSVGNNVSIDNGYGVPIQVSVPPIFLNDTTIKLQLATVPSYASPGTLQSSNPGGKTNSTALQSFGMFYINIVKENGESIPFPQEGITFTLNTSSIVDSNDTDPIDWYYFNSTTNKWDLPTSNANLKSKSSLLNTISTASQQNAQAQAAGYWNFDRNFRTSCVTGRLVTSSGQPCNGGVIKASGVDGISSIGTADSLGYFCVCGAVTLTSVFYYGSTSTSYTFPNIPGSCDVPSANIGKYVINNANICPELTTSIPTRAPTITRNPTKIPTIHPSISPTRIPSSHPTIAPTVKPSSYPTIQPTIYNKFDHSFQLCSNCEQFQLPESLYDSNDNIVSYSDDNMATSSDTQGFSILTLFKEAVSDSIITSEVIVLAENSFEDLISSEIVDAILPNDPAFSQFLKPFVNKVVSKVVSTTLKALCPVCVVGLEIAHIISGSNDFINAIEDNDVNKATESIKDVKENAKVLIKQIKSKSINVDIGNKIPLALTTKSVGFSIVYNITVLVDPLVNISNGLFNSSDSIVKLINQALSNHSLVESTYRQTARDLLDYGYNNSGIIISCNSSIIQLIANETYTKLLATGTSTNYTEISLFQNLTTSPTVSPSSLPTNLPTCLPTNLPTSLPTNLPISLPTYSPSGLPTYSPTNLPTLGNPTKNPTRAPTAHPTTSPTIHPTVLPTTRPTVRPTSLPTKQPVHTVSISVSDILYIAMISFAGISVLYLLIHYAPLLYGAL